MHTRKQTSQELFRGPVTEQGGMGWSVSTWLNFAISEQDVCIQTTTGNGPGPLPSAEPCQGVDWELLAALGQKVS